jgi:hypothetical protein
MGGSSYDADRAIDGDMTTAWVEGADGAGIGEALTLRLTPASRVASVAIAPGYFKNASVWAKNNRLKRATLELSDGRRIPATFDDAMRVQSVPVGGGPISWIRIVIDDAYLGGDALDTAISEATIDTAR